MGDACFDRGLWEEIVRQGVEVEVLPALEAEV
jgi:hypothetical protein